METGKYIFYVFDSLNLVHIELALESIARQSFEPMDFALYNNSSTFVESLILEKTRDILGNRFKSYTHIIGYPETDLVLADVQHQLAHIDSADYYFMHKADFYLGKGVIAEAQTYRAHTSPLFVNFCKFDLRETVTAREIVDLAQMTWDEILQLNSAWDVTPGFLPIDFGTHYDKIGYRGWDGTMHFYNEAARQLIEMDTFCKPETVEANRAKGVDWIYGDTRFLALHMFHEVPGGRGDKSKDVPGHRY